MVAAQLESSKNAKVLHLRTIFAMATNFADAGLNEHKPSWHSCIRSIRELGGLCFGHKREYIMIADEELKEELGLFVRGKRRFVYKPNGFTDD